MKNEKEIFQSRGCHCSPKLTYQTHESVYSHGCCKLDTFDWMEKVKLPPNHLEIEFAEVRFKNNRKEFFRNTERMQLSVGDIVAVEVNPGHDIGIVSMTGELVLFQMRRKRIDTRRTDIKKIYRKARPADIEKWIMSAELEEPTLYKARKIADQLKLRMKINDIEYQGDKTKAIFYYTADDRVDFRELIKIMAEKFMVRIEMRQIGARQEASRLGGLGSCGRELCCATWIAGFKTVSTNTARTQQLTLNPQKLTGLCSKLKCCLNYENSWYTEALKSFPDNTINLKTKKGELRCLKNDVVKKTMSYSYIDEKSIELFVVSTDNVKKIIQFNKDGITPETIEEFAIEKETKIEYDITMEDMTMLNEKEKYEAAD